MTPFSNMIPHLHSKLRDCPPALVIQATRSAVIDFCRDTLCWRRELPAINIVAGQSEYAIESDITVTSVHRILKATIDGCILRPHLDYGWSEDKTELVLVHEPKVSIAPGLVVVVALKPLQSAMSIDNDRMWDDYLDTFMYGAASLLFSERDKPWTDMNLAEVSRLKFRNGVGKAIDEVRRRGLHVLTRARPTYGFI